MTWQEKEIIIDGCITVILLALWYVLTWAKERLDQ